MNATLFIFLFMHSLHSLFKMQATYASKSYLNYGKQHQFISSILFAAFAIYVWNLK